VWCRSRRLRSRHSAARLHRRVPQPGSGAAKTGGLPIGFGFTPKKARSRQGHAVIFADEDIADRERLCARSATGAAVIETGEDPVCGTLSLSPEVLPNDTEHTFTVIRRSLVFADRGRPSVVLDEILTICPAKFEAKLASPSAWGAQADRKRGPPGGGGFLAAPHTSSVNGVDRCGVEQAAGMRRYSFKKPRPWCCSGDRNAAVRNLPVHEREPASFPIAAQARVLASSSVQGGYLSWLQRPRPPADTADAALLK